MMDAPPEVTPSSVTCFLPARLGSKRLPRKNIRPLAGRPMLAWTIAAAQESGCFEEVHVCTDAPEIARLAEQHGAKGWLVPDELCGDLVPSWRPCVHVAHRLRAEGVPVDALACVQPTSPLRSPEDIRAGVRTLLDQEASFVVSVTEIDPHFFHWAIEKRADETWVLTFGDRFLTERQLLPVRYRPNGSLKLARLEALQDVGHFFGQPLECFVTPEERSLHVATELDFQLAELLLRQRAS